MTSSSWYRRSFFGVKGNREYTKAGFEHASQRFGEKDLEVDCSDRHFMITGGNSGIGLATASEIAKRGGILHLVCRNAKSMKEARSHIITNTGNDRIYQHQVNLAKPAEVAKWAKEFTESHGRLDVLIHNAGLLINEREVDEDNIETMFAVHSLAVHLITLILLPVLRRSNDPRVIIVSSAGMLTVRLDSSDLNFEKMNPFNGRLAYAQTKRQQVVMNFSYAQRYDKVKFFSMHPGWADTPGVEKGLPEFYEQTKEKLRTPEQGADTIIWLAISAAALKHSSGLFFQDRVPIATHLPLAWTRTSTAEEQQFMTILDKLFVQYSSLDPDEIPKFSGHRDRVELNSEHQSILHHPSEDEQEEKERERNPVTTVDREVEGTIEEAAVIINEENLNREKMPENDKTESSEFHDEKEFTANAAYDNSPTSKEENKINHEINPLNELSDKSPSSIFENSAEENSNKKVIHVKEAENIDSSCNGSPNDDVVTNASNITNEDENKHSEHNETNKEPSASALAQTPEKTTLEESENKVHNDLKLTETHNGEAVVNES